ncbi:hypothetical protein MAPG_08636 [Magnaporthiopsis poae ATCC 64411]|uniref:Uncharacterized protein n=1 Tax=Magnaporthiopsis poae (strain ATCC 64411 / 73-15) TaxID=644358 RepID=A0A0C4E7W1_MAGP6|nr:hypothetical protein MAPG_08636 [Magnaporthiopsis poae ATCC 64411]
MRGLIPHPSRGSSHTAAAAHILHCRHTGEANKRAVRPWTARAAPLLLGEADRHASLPQGDKLMCTGVTHSVQLPARYTATAQPPPTLASQTQLENYTSQTIVLRSGRGWQLARPLGKSMVILAVAPDLIRKSENRFFAFSLLGGDDGPNACANCVAETRIAGTALIPGPVPPCTSGLRALLVQYPDHQSPDPFPNPIHPTLGMKKVLADGKTRGDERGPRGGGR